jgi:hypothetical protein
MGAGQPAGACFGELGHASASGAGNRFKAPTADTLAADRDQSGWHHGQDAHLVVHPSPGSASMRARFEFRLTHRRVMTQAQLADTLTGCVNQQVNQAQPGSITGGTTLYAGFDDGEVTASPGMMPLRAGLPDRTVPSGAPERITASGLTSVTCAF